MDFVHWFWFYIFVSYTIWRLFIREMVVANQTNTWELANFSIAHWLERLIYSPTPCFPIPLPLPNFRMLLVGAMSPSGFEIYYSIVSKKKKKKIVPHLPCRFRILVPHVTLLKKQYWDLIWHCLVLIAKALNFREFGICVSHKLYGWYF